MARLQIDPASWTALNQLLDEALDRPVADRSAWVDALDQQFAQLKPRLRELLARAASVETGDFLGTMPKFGVGEETAHAPGATAGEMIGVYRLVRELGAGGMGSVWLAERADGLFQRPVALKLPHLIASRDAGLAERMAREREILATLDHRNIAKLLDAGITADGQPFMALEYVEGIPVDQYCAGTDGTALPIEARLRLFRQVAEAVAYAHGKLIVHRDLKPANILVTAGGGVKLLDFGIAKLLDQGTAAETRLTRVAGRALTPDYASPEQILGEPLTVASDVYSLGVVLFELLTGTRPYRLKRDSRGALEDAIVQAEPPRASQTAAAEARRRLRGDLDTIVAKALKKNPLERYATVNAFVDDIARYLEQRPVLARPDSRWYRLRKFVARNKLVVGGGATVLTAIIAGAGVALWQAKVARAEQVRADTVKKLIVSVFEQADPNANGGQPFTVSDLLQKASQNLLTDSELDVQVRAEVAHVLGSTLVRLRDIDVAERIARESLAQVETQFPPSSIVSIRARMLVSQVERFRGNTDAMRQQLTAVLPHIEAQQAEYPDDYVLALKSMATQEIDAGNYNDAIGWASRSAAFSNRQFGVVDDRSIEALHQLALAQVFAKDTGPALSSARLAQERAQQAHPGGEHPLVIDTHLVYGRALNLAGDYRNAVDQIQFALSGVDRIWGPDSIKAGFFSQNLAQAQINAGKLTDACESTARSVRNLATTFNPASYSYVAMWSVHGRARLYSRQGAEALQSFERVLPQLVQVFGQNDSRSFDERSYHALAVALTGDVARAERLAEELLADLKAAGEFKTHRPYFARARIARLRNDPETALKAASAASGVEESLTLNWERAAVLAEIGYAQIGLGDPSAGEASLRRALELLDKSGHDDTPERADVLDALSRVSTGAEPGKKVARAT